MPVREIKVTPDQLAIYNHAYHNLIYRELTTAFDKAMPIETAIDAAILLQNACFEHTDGIQRGMNEIMLRRSILTYLNGTAWSECIKTLNAYLWRFNK